MKRLTVLATLCLGLAALGRGLAAVEPQADDPAPVADCPYCGRWAPAGAEPGERIVIGTQSVTLPGCGEFRIDEIDTMTWSEDAGRRAYRAVLRLRPAAPDRGCGSADEGLVRLEVSVVDGPPGRGTGRADLALFHDDSDAPRLTAVGVSSDEAHAAALRP